MYQVQFYYLQRPIQDRFIESTRGKGAPTPVLYQPPGTDPWAFGLAITGAVLLTACGVFACLGFGNLENRLALNPLWTIGIYSGLLCAAMGGLLKATLIWNRAALLPFRRGVHAFPAVVIDARSSMLEVHKLSELADISNMGSQVTLRFTDGAIFEFRDVDPSRVEDIKAKFLDAQQRLSAPPSETFGRDQALLDPLADSGFKSLFSPSESMKPRVISWGGYWFLIAVFVGIAVGVGVWKTRNALSAKQLYIRARTLDSTHGYLAYLARGGKRNDVRALLLPRAELREARAAGTVDAIERFMDEHPKSKINSEATLALYSAMLRDLETARAAGTLSALRDFRKGDPRVSLVESERSAAQKALFRAALVRFQSESLGAPELEAFVERLLSYAEQHGPKVEIRFRRRIPASAVMIETQIQKSSYFGGSRTLPLQYFDTKHSQAREAMIASAISQRLAAVFPKDILSFELVQDRSDDDTGLPAVTSPALFITHTTNMISVHTSRKPRGAFAGIGFQFKAQLLLPQDTAPPTFNCSVWMAPDFKKFEDEGWTAESLYEYMATEAFSQFLKKYFASIFHA
jgi:hypothetical protein